MNTVAEDSILAGHEHPTVAEDSILAGGECPSGDAARLQTSATTGPDFFERVKAGELAVLEAKSSRSILLAIIAAAVLLRVALALFLGDQIGDLRGGTYDQISYDALARRVATGHGFSFGQSWWPLTAANEPTSHWSFAYTLYLATVYRLFGSHPLAARLLQALVTGVMLPLLVYRLGARAFARRIGLLAAALAAVYLYLAHYAAALMTEAFYICGILWSLNLAFALHERVRAPAVDSRAKRPGLWVPALLLGFALAITILLRQVFLPFIPLLLLWLGWPLQKYLGWRRALTLLTVIAVILAIFILPWSLRNYLLFDEITLLNTNAGYAFFWSNHPIHGRSPLGHITAETGTTYQALIPAELHHLNEAALEKALLRRGLGFVLADPGRYLHLSLARIPVYFLCWPSAASSALNNLARVVSAGWLVPLGLTGSALSLRRDTATIRTGLRVCRQRKHILGGLTDNPRIYQRLLLLLFMSSYTGIHLASWASVRYRLPVDAVALPFAALALTEAWRTLRHRLPQRRLALRP